MQILNETIDNTSSKLATRPMQITHEVIKMRSELHGAEIDFKDAEIITFGVHYFDSVFTKKTLSIFIESLPDNRGKSRSAKGPTRRTVTSKMHPYVWHSMMETVKNMGIANPSYSDSFNAVVFAAYTAKIKNPKLSESFGGFLRIPVIKLKSKNGF